MQVFKEPAASHDRSAAWMVCFFDIGGDIVGWKGGLVEKK